MFPQGFNARTVEPAGVGSQLPISPPEGWLVIINGHEMVAVNGKPNDGMCVFNLLVVDGAAKGSEGPYRLNLFNSSEQSAKIAAQQLSSLCHVTGKLDAQREEELYNVPFRVVVVAQTGEGKENFTQVKKVMDAQGNAPGKAGAATAAPAPPANVPPAPPAQPAAATWGAPAATTEPAAQAQPTWQAQPAAATASAPPWAK